MTRISPEREGGNREGLWAAQLRLSDYRNYENLELNLDPGLNILYGHNAQGKTNVLEAIHLVATTRLLRGSRDAEAVREGAPQAVVAVQTEPFGSELSLILIPGRKKTARLNGMALPRAADLIGRLPCVSMSQGDMEIVRGSPETRRMYLDLELAQLFPAYLNHLAHYKRSLEQRNALLRRAQEFPVDDLEFEPWEGKLAEHGAAIREARRSLVQQLGPLAQDVQASLAGREEFRLEYEVKDDFFFSQELQEQLERTRRLDAARGVTQLGPHRDDLAIQVAGRDARYFGSQGQQRTAVLALKLGNILHRLAQEGQAPLLLLDDVLSDLDAGRRARLVEWILAHARQAVLTCNEPEAAGQELLQKAALFQVRSGTVQSVTAKKGPSR
jgi:DNA replication and repair protein RecF